MIHFKHKKNRVMSHVVDGYDFATDRHQQEFVLSRIPTGKGGRGGKERGERKKVRNGEKEEGQGMGLRESVCEDN